jgi:molybdopterin converting factor small subunit
MHVTVKLFATLRKDRFDEKELELADGVTAGEIIDMIAVPPTEVTLIFINSRHSVPEAKLADGDTLALFPPIGGG